MKTRGHEVFLAMPYNTDTTYYKLISPFCEEVFFLNWMPWSVFESSKLGSQVLQKTSFLAYQGAF